MASKRTVGLVLVTVTSRRQLEAKQRENCHCYLRKCRHAVFLGVKKHKNTNSKFYHIPAPHQSQSTVVEFRLDESIGLKVSSTTLVFAAQKVTVEEVVSRNESSGRQQ